MTWRVHIGKCQSGYQPPPQISRYHPSLPIRAPAAQEENPWGIWVTVLESTCLSTGRSHANIPSTHCYHHVCLPSHSNKGEKRSFGSSRSGNSAGTMRSRCVGRRRGGGQSMSRYWEVASPLTQGLMGPAAPLSSGAWDMVSQDCSMMAFAFSQAAVLTYSKCQVHSLRMPMLPTQTRTSPGIPGTL